MTDETDSQLIIENLVGTLEDVIQQACWSEADQLLDSMALSAYAVGLRVLAAQGRVRITADIGRRVIAEWVEH